MIRLDSRTHGYTLHLLGRVQLTQIQETARALRNERAGAGDDAFVLVLDARKFGYISADAQASLEELLEESAQSGLVRLAVLAVSTVHANLFCEMMKRCDLMDIYEYLDLSYEEDWEGELAAFLDTPFAD